MYRLSSNCRYRAVPGVSDVGVVMSWMWERILLSKYVFLSRSSGSIVLSRTVHSMSGIYFTLGVYGPLTEAEAPWGEVDSACGTLLLPTVRDVLCEDLSVIVVRKGVLCLLLLRDRLGEVDRGRGIRKRGG